MAVTARFEADFSSFLNAVDQAEAKLVDFQSGAGRVEASLSRMVDTFSGRKVIQDATLMAEAVDRVGGTSQLTQTELGRVGAKAQEAADKLRAMGQDVPPKIQAIASSFHDLSNSGQEAKSWVESLGESFAAHVAEGVLLRDVIREIITVGEEAFTKAARFEDLARATGLSIDEIQRFSYVGKEFGVDAEVMARAVEQLSAKLASGDQNAVKAVQMLGLSVKELIAVGPKEAFLEVAEATGRVEDPMLKNAVAADEFGGKLAKILIPALGELRQKMADIPKGAILSDQNVVSAHELEVSWGHLKDVWGNVFVDLVVRTAEAFGGQTVKMKESKQATDEHRGADIELLSTSQALENRLKSLRTEAIEPLTDKQKAAILELKGYGESQKDIAELVKASEGAVRKYIEAQKDAEEASKKYAESAKAYDKAWSDFHLETLKLAGEHEKQWGEDRKKHLDEVNKSVIEGFRQIRTAQQTLQDFEDQSWMDATDFQVKKIWERANEEIRSFKGTEAERASFNTAILTLASAQADAIYAKDVQFANATLELFRKVQRTVTEEAALTAAIIAGTSGLSNDDFLKLLGQRQAAGLTPTGLASSSSSGSMFTTSLFDHGVVQSRDIGGPVSAGQSYYIGKGAQPELFTPKSDGWMTPSGAGGLQITINVTQPLGTPQAIADAVSAALMQKLRGQGMRGVSGA